MLHSGNIFLPLNLARGAPSTHPLARTRSRRSKKAIKLGLGDHQQLGVIVRSPPIDRSVPGADWSRRRRLGTRDQIA